VLVACGEDRAIRDDAAVPPPLMIQAPATFGVVEGETDWFVVKLAADPLDDVTIDVVSRDPATAAVVTSSITLSSATYAAGVAIEVAAAEDDDNVINEKTAIELSVDGVIAAQVATTAIDNDIQQLVVDPPTLMINEAGAATFTVRLARRPASTTTATLTSSASQVATAAPAMLTFAAADYAVPQTVTVSAPADLDIANNTAIITVGDVPGTNARTVQVDVSDDDLQTLVLDTTSVAINEGGSGTFAVSLAFDPGAPVQVHVQSSDPLTAHVTVASLPFDSSNYAVPQIVTVSGVDDNDRLNDNISVNLSGPATGSVAVSVTDNDDIIIGSGTSYVQEGRVTQFAVSLANDPGPGGKTVDIDVLSGDVVVLQDTLTFTSANYNSAQDARVYALADAASSADKQAVVRVSAPGQTPGDKAITIWNRTNVGALSVTFQHESMSVGKLGWMDVKLTPDTVLPGDGRIVITFPPVYDVSGATLASSSLDGTSSLTATTSTVTLTRAGGSALYYPTQISLRLGNVRNAGVSGTHSIAVATQTSSSGALDSGTGQHLVWWGALAAAAVDLETDDPGATGSVTFTFTTNTDWPADGKLELMFPVDFDTSAVTMVAQSGIDGSLAAAATAPARVVLTRSGGAALAAGNPVSVTVGNIINPATPRATSAFEIVTQSATGGWIETGFPPGVTIGSP
jgi:hypothetical protein